MLIRTDRHLCQYLHNISFELSSAFADYKKNQNYSIQGNKKNTLSFLSTIFISLPANEAKEKGAFCTCTVPMMRNTPVAPSCGQSSHFLTFHGPVPPVYLCKRKTWLDFLVRERMQKQLSRQAELDCTADCFRAASALCDCPLATPLTDY